MRNFDQSVVEKVRVGTAATLDAVARRLWRLTRYALREKAVFEDGTHRFHLEQSVLSSELTPVGHYYLKGATGGQGYLYRIGHPLAQHLIEGSLSASTPVATLRFSLSSHELQQSGLKAFVGKTGWLKVYRVRFQFRDGNSEEHILALGTDDEGAVIDAELGAAFFELDGTVVNRAGHLTATRESDLESRLADECARKSKDLVARATRLLQEEAGKLEAWEEDQRAQFSAHYRELEEKFRVIVRKLSTSMDFSASLAFEEEKIRLRGAMDRENARFREQCVDLEEKKLGLLQQKKLRLSHEQVVEPQFVVRWELEN
jgi:hypothetical protein